MNPQPEDIVQRVVLKGVNDGAQQTITGVRDQVKGLGADLAQLDAVGQRTILPFDGLAAEARQAAIPFEDIEQSVKSAADQAERLQSGVKGAASSGKGFGLSDVRSVAGQAGGLLSVVGAGQAGSALSSILALTSTLGPAGLAAGLFAVKLKSVQEEEQKAAQNAQQFVSGLKSVQEQIAGGATSQDIQKQVERLKVVQTQQQDTYDTLSEFEKRRNELIKAQVMGQVDQKTFDDFSHALETQIAAATGGAVSSANLSAALLQAKANLDETQVSIGVYTVGLKSQALGANDAAASIEKVGQQIGEAAARLFSIPSGIAAAGLNIGSIVGDAFKGINAVISGQADSYFAALGDITATQQKIFETEQDIANTRSEAVAKEAAIVLDGQAQITLAEEGAGERRGEIVQQGLDDIARIQRDQFRADRDAVRNRDVLSKIQADEKAQDALDDEAKSQEKQLATVAKGLEKQERTIKTSTDKQVATIEAAAVKEIAIKQHSLQQEQVDLQNQTNAVSQISINGAGQLRTIHGDFWQGVNAIAVTMVANTLNTLRTLVDSFQSIGATPNSPLTQAVNNLIDTRLRQVYEP